MFIDRAARRIYIYIYVYDYVIITVRTWNLHSKIKTPNYLSQTLTFTKQHCIT